jgi:murein DD-endopeptidase MepM/ murein hydrolase activator NlpD
VVVRQRRRRFLLLFVLAVLAVTAYAVTELADRSTAQVSQAELLVAEEKPADGPVDPNGPTHPVFARLDDRNLVLPVAARSATIIAYEPLIDERGIPLSPAGTRINGGVVSRSIARVFSGDSSIKYYQFEAEGRSLSKTGSVDVGAAPGTPIVAPVSGVVTGISEYLLYGKYEDIQVDIAPDGVSDATVSILFVQEPVVTIGQTVEAGKTQIGLVREAAGDLGARLAEHTHDSGSHVHIQVMHGLAQ